MKRVFGLVLFFGLLILVNSFKPLASLRGYLERLIILPFSGVSQEQNVSQIKVQSLREELRQLSEENERLREQLGAIPERANLFPAKVISATATDYYLSYSYPNREVVEGQPVVLGKIYLGRVERIGEQRLVVRKPTSSGFVAQGRTEKGTEGRVLGKFNEQLIFETGVNHSLEKGEAVYLIEPERGWRFLLGKVSEISRDKRQPLKQAVIDYLPQQAVLSTVFVVE